MRTKLFNPDVALMKYGIREIVDVAQKLKELNPKFVFIGENIGDPVAKGWPVPPFFKEILIEEIRREDDTVFGYSHSRGIPEVRKWIVELAAKHAPSSNLDYEYVLFTSGLGAAISAIYHMLPPGARIIQPTPAYPTHASMESFGQGSDPVLYNLNPKQNWEPDLNDLEAKIKENPAVAGILIINPNNPTGAVYSKATLEKIVKLAEKYQLMLISDEVYFRMVYNGFEYAQLTELAANRVPLIVMRGVSKDIPWPGGRSGWLEFHNVGLDTEYKNYVESVKKRVLMEVCSTTMPQRVIPRVYDHPDFPEWNRKYNAELEKNGNNIAEILGNTRGLKVNRANGAFYMMPLFEEGILNDKQSLPIADEASRKYIEQEVSRPGMPPDQRFTYYLLAATGICVVPASGFFSPYYGFRLTTLDRDETRRNKTYATLSAAIGEYLK